MSESRTSEDEVYRYLVETLQPIYADLVATLGEKPTQVVFQLEAAFVHLALARTNPDVYDEQGVGFVIGVLASLLAIGLVSLL